MNKLSVVAIFVLVSALGCTDRPEEASPEAMAEAPRPFEGAWRAIEITTTGAEGSVDSNPGPDLRIFEGTHYSWLSADAGRVQPDLATATAAEWSTVYGTGFAANSGTFEVAGNEITFRPIVAKNPSVMAEGHFYVTTWRMAGDSLWLSHVRTAGDEVANPSTVKYVRTP